MEIIIKKKHTVTFSVWYFEDTEGGMISDSFGADVDTLEEAIAMLEKAVAKDGCYDWRIVANVVTESESYA